MLEILLTTAEMRAEIHAIADTSPGQWARWADAYGARRQHLDFAIDVLLGIDGPYVPLQAVLADTYLPPPRYGPRTRIPAAIRAIVFERDGYACKRCGSQFDLSVDHILAWSLGGSDDPENLQTLCRSCNSRKGARING